MSSPAAAASGIVLMFRRMGLRGQGLFFVIAVLLVTGTVLFVQSYFGLRQMATLTEDERRTAIMGMMVEITHNEEEQLKDQLQNVVSIKALKTMYHDRATLSDNFYPILNRLYKDGIRRLTFYDDSGNVYLKAHAVGKGSAGLADTSISPGRTLPQLALKKDQIVAGIEYDEDELLQFVVTPYYLQGKRVGVLEIGGSLGRQVNALKKFHNVDGGLLLHDRQMVNPTTPDLVDQAFRLGKPGEFRHNGEWYSTFRIPVEGQDASYLVVANTTGVRRLLQSSLMKLFLQVAGVLALVIPLAIMGINVLWRPLVGVIGSVQAVAQQDLSVVVGTAGSGEVAILTGAVNTMITDLRALVGAIMEMSQKVHQMAADLSNVLEEQVTSSVMQSTGVAEVTTSIEELTRISQKNTESAEGVAVTAEGALATSRLGTEAIGESADKIDQVSAQNRVNLEKLSSLRRQFAKIGEVANFITEMAYQTRLIAFNATLKASEGGEAGRAFGVIAREIRELAENVAGYARQINTQISEIQDATNELAAAAESTTLRIEEGHLTNQNAKQAFERIVGEIQKTAGEAHHISQASLQQQQACEQSLSAFRQIAQGVKSLADASQEARASVTRLVEFAGSVEKLVANFKLQ